MKRIIIYAVAIMASNQAMAQRTKTEINPSDNPPVQVSFIYPLSTSGWNAINNKHNLSVHIMAGATAETEGLEIAGFANFNRYGLHGVQASGFANYLGGDGRGVQGSGFANFTAGNFKGVQGSGFTNISLGHTEGVQGAGFANYSHGNNGVQGAGFANINVKAGEGVQAAGFSNVAVGGQVGVQAAGFANVSLDSSAGVQVSGFVNFAQKHKGLQVGVFNYADTLDGIAIGLLSYSKSGYHRLELSANETFQTNIAFRTGSKAFYNVFQAGIHWDKDNPVWSLGYGIGTTVLDRGPWSADLDLISNVLLPQDFETDEWNSLNTLRISVVRTVNNLQFFAGASLNAFIYENTNKNTDIAPWVGFEGVERGTNYIVYPGFQIGVRI
jgi:hypothetical protein